MVIKMTKYSFILLDKDLNGFLEQLQEWGVVDITRTYKPADEKSQEYLDLSRRYSSAIRELKNYKVKEDCVDNTGKIEEGNLLEIVERRLERARALAARSMELQKERTASKCWGDFNADDIRKLEELNLVLHFHTVPEAKFKEVWEKAYSLQILNKENGRVYFVVLTSKFDDGEYSFPVAEAKFPERGFAEIDKEIAQNEMDMRENESALLALQSRLDLLKQLKTEQDAVLDIYMANLTSEKVAEGQIAVVQGFAPTDNEAELAQKLESCDVYYIAEPATKEDNPPIKLKNNFFATLFEPIGNLYMLPKYGELDLTPFFAPFYMLFFGLCLGDMGYGLLLLIAGLVAMFKLPKLKNYAKLVMLLGLGSIIMPAMTGTFFGVSLYDHVAMPQWLYDNWYNPETINIKMFWFALIFGVFQICVGRLISAFYAFKQQGWQYGLANIGWAVFSVWASIFFAEWQGGFTFLTPLANYIMLGISGVCIIFFSKISSNIFFRIAGGVKAVYDVTGLLGDILSYVRLFGLGAAGGILGLVMNQIALSFVSIPYVGWLFFIIMLVIGHSLVLFLSCLGAFVHPIRLTFVEFYKNANFQGGGRKFNPLKK